MLAIGEVGSSTLDFFPLASLKPCRVLWPLGESARPSSASIDPGRLPGLPGELLTLLSAIRISDQLPSPVGSGSGDQGFAGLGFGWLPTGRIPRGGDAPAGPLGMTSGLEFGLLAICALATGTLEAGRDNLGVSSAF